ncbi:MAG: hypothetical protein OEU54_07150 [Gemmatimonadota bacterium]|nr:hypothetical protein [Gemmatimonadota bacterium]
MTAKARTPARSRPRPSPASGSNQDAGARRIVLLGPQRDRPTLADTIIALKGSDVLPSGARLATVTAGWQDREGDPELTPVDAGTEVVDLGLYAGANRVAEADPDLAAGHHDAQRRLRELRRAYNLRLRGAMSTWTSLGAMTGDERVLEPERADALSSIRALDTRHLARVAEIRGVYEERFRPHERDSVQAERAGIEQRLEDTDGLVFAGGHVATLINRLRMFDLAGLLGELPIIAWSAGAMALGARVVLFHDRPPWGPGNAEAFEIGLGVFDGLLPLPHATARLALDEPERMGRLSRRFRPTVCVLLDPGTRLDRVEGRWVAEEARQVDQRGTVSPFGALAA